jgi:hypothetical protein
MPGISYWELNQTNLITFVLINAAGNEVAGIGNAFTLEVSKGGAAFAGSAGTKTEIGSGWYAYLTTAGEADTTGPVSVKVTHASTIQQNLEYVVRDRNLNGISFTYTITDSVSTNPIAGVSVDVATDVAGANVVWGGVTDSFGVARDDNGDLPFLDAGTYQFFSRIAGYFGANPDAEAVAIGNTTGERTLTPITAGAAVGTGIAQALPWTGLALSRYAKILGLNPVHFTRSTASALDPVVFPVNNCCGGLWPKYTWQNNDQVSWEEVNLAIQSAESDIARELGYWPFPLWINNEMHQYPRPYYRAAFGNGIGVRGEMKSLRAKWGKFIQAGRRAVTLVGTATVGGGGINYSDEDGDGFAETATITAATALTNACEIKVYFAAHNGDQDWEIREPRSKSISGGTYTATFDSWLFIDPDLLEAYPTSAGFSAIDISTTANYVSSVDVYREYTDFTEVSAQFFWERDPVTNSLVFCSTCGGTGCETCTLVTQDGCIHVRDVPRGIVVPVAASYDSTDARWEGLNWTDCREPDQVKIWYYAGDLDNRFLGDISCAPLSDYWAQTIAWLATSRIAKPFCACGGSDSKREWLQQDLGRSGEVSFLIAENQLSNPWGTRRGAIMAWDRVAKLNNKRFVGAAI